MISIKCNIVPPVSLKTEAFSWQVFPCQISVFSFQRNILSTTTQCWVEKKSASQNLRHKCAGFDHCYNIKHKSIVQDHIKGQFIAIYIYMYLHIYIKADKLFRDYSTWILKQFVHTGWCCNLCNKYTLYISTLYKLVNGSLNNSWEKPIYLYVLTNKVKLR